jgi:2-isopropylmalate synthase
LFLPLIPFRPYNSGGDVVQRALTVMNDARNVAMRLPDVAEKVGCSEEYLVRCFKKGGLDTPNTIFKRIKLRYAKSLLSSTKISVSEVATVIGFRSVGHFNKLYFSEYGVCPGVDKNR